MYTQEFVDSLPYWALVLIPTIVIILSIEIGWRLGNVSRLKNILGNPTSIDKIVTTTLGLLSFLLAFTFGMAESFYENRVAMIIAESNAIDTVYLRTDFLPDSLRDDARQLLRDYTALRSEGISTIMSTDGIAKADDIQNRLWKIGTQAIMQSNSVSNGLFIEGLNGMIDVDINRQAGLRKTLPGSVWLMLTLLTISGMAALGYDLGLAGNRKWIGTLILIIAFSLVIVFIADLDRPHSGFLQISQQPLLDLMAKMNG